MLNPISFSLRALAASDIQATHALSQAVGWTHRLADWDLLQRIGRGHVAADDRGSVRGIAMWWPQGRNFATLGMVIVAPELQRSGIGRRLMAKVLEDIGPRRIQLVATREGQALYDSLGFDVTGGITQRSGILDAGAEPAVIGTAVRSFEAGDLAAIHALDFGASGVDRSDVLAGLLPVSEGFVADRNGLLTGYALCRDFGRGRVVGPIVADDEDTSLALLSTAMVKTGGFLRADVPSDAARLIDWLERAGLRQGGAAQVMQRGPAAPIADGPRIFGLASQALG
ncbi:GNAT family N-acetyltransferase [Rhizobium lusitanum]|uniref:GNAT family N-acetyltransferase n=1 Tax=Rhizobium lusitanum TaxID=293958 RepID=UPI00195C6BE8|nr:GNAT family N-acetyltransferase [Rhizobium lusitanum]MBM7047161.1 GNAT family N-acetyltransferase [Rhizobium lusitanum]